MKGTAAISRSGDSSAHVAGAHRLTLQLIALVTCVLHCALVVGVPLAQSSSAAAQLRDATGHFDEGNFEAALTTIDAVLARADLNTRELRSSHALKARCEAEMGNSANAINSFCQVILIDPQWRPDPMLYTANELGLYEQARNRCQPAEQRSAQTGTPWYRKPLTWIAGGAVVGILAFVVAGGSDSSDGDGNGEPSGDLPDFPPPP